MARNLLKSPSLSSSSLFPSLFSLPSSNPVHSCFKSHPTFSRNPAKNHFVQKRCFAFVPSETWGTVFQSSLMTSPLDLRRRANELWEQGIRVRDEGDIKKAELCFGAAYNTLKDGYEGIISKDPSVKESLCIQLARLSVATAQVSASIFALDEAKRDYEAALDWIAGMDSPEVLKCLAEVYINYSDYYLQTQEFSQGEELLHKAVAIVEKYLPTRKEYLGFVLNNLGVLQAHQSKFEEAEKSFLRAFDILVFSLGPMDDFTLHVFNNYGKFADKSKEPIKFEELLEKLQNSVLSPEIPSLKVDVDTTPECQQLMDDWKEQENKISYYDLYGFRKSKRFVTWEMNEFSKAWVQRGLPLFPEILEKVRSEIVDMYEPKQKFIPGMLKRTDLPYHFVRRRIREGASDEQILQELEQIKEAEAYPQDLRLPKRPTKWKGRQIIDEEWVSRFEQGTLPPVPNQIEEEYYNTVAREHQIPLNLFNLDALGRFRSGDYVLNPRTQTWRNLVITNEELTVVYEESLKDYIRTANMLEAMKRQERASFDKWDNLTLDGKKRYLDILDEVAHEMTEETADPKTLDWFRLFLSNHVDAWKIGDLSYGHGWEPRDDDTPVNRLNQWINGVIPFPLGVEEIAEIPQEELEDSGYFDDLFVEAHGNALSERLIDEDLRAVETNVAKIKKAVSDRLPPLFHHTSDYEHHMANWFVVDTGVSGVFSHWTPAKRYALTKKYFWEKLPVQVPPPTIPPEVDRVEQYGLDASLGLKEYTTLQKQWEIEVQENLRQLAIAGKELNLPTKKSSSSSSSPSENDEKDAKSTPQKKQAKENKDSKQSNKKQNNQPDQAKQKKQQKAK